MGARVPVNITCSKAELSEWRRRAEVARAQGANLMGGASVSGQIMLAQRGSSAELENLRQQVREAMHSIELVATLLECGSCSTADAVRWLREARARATSCGHSNELSGISTV